MIAVYDRLVALWIVYFSFSLYVVGCLLVFMWLFSCKVFGCCWLMMLVGVVLMLLVFMLVRFLYLLIAYLVGVFC